jgi:hypothetical protein
MVDFTSFSNIGIGVITKVKSFLKESVSGSLGFAAWVHIIQNVSILPQNPVYISNDIVRIPGLSVVESISTMI